MFAERPSVASAGSPWELPTSDLFFQGFPFIFFIFLLQPVFLGLSPFLLHLSSFLLLSLFFFLLWWFCYFLPLSFYIFFLIPISFPTSFLFSFPFSYISQFLTSFLFPFSLFQTFTGFPTSFLFPFSLSLFLLVLLHPSSFLFHFSYFYRLSYIPLSSSRFFFFPFILFSGFPNFSLSYSTTVSISKIYLNYTAMTLCFLALRHFIYIRKCLLWRLE